MQCHDYDDTPNKAKKKKKLLFVKITVFQSDTAEHLKSINT